MSKTKQNITSKITAHVTGRIASIRIVDYIGEYSESGSGSIREQVDAMLKENITSAEVYLNSRGGSVFEATEIANELARFASVTLRIGALAASATTYLTSKFKTVANPNSQLMIHRPRLTTSGNINQIESDLKLLKNITEDYKNAYVAKTGKTPEQIEALWASGDHWMTAQEALAEKFIDEIATSSPDAEAVTEQDVALLEASGAPVIPTLTNNKNTIPTMERMKIIAALGLAADATDDQIEAKAKELKLNSLSYETQKEAAQKARKDKAKALVAKAVADKKILAEKAEKYEVFAESDYESVAELFESMEATPRLSSHLKQSASKEAKAEAGRESWTLDDYIEKDPVALEKLYEENPELVAKLEAGYFKK